MPTFGSVERGYLSRLMASRPQTRHGLVDMRSYDWSAAPHNPKVRPTYHEDYIVKADFSNSKADEGFRVSGAVFEECVFDRSVWWLMVFSKCRFTKCSFDNCSLYNSAFGGEFHHCSFKNVSAKGEGFDFGWGSLYKNCTFESAALRNIDEVIGVRFEDCRIQGTLTNGILRGRRYALRQRLRSLSDLLFSTSYRSVAFIHCDLSGLETQNVVFEKDIVFKDNKVGSRSFFT